MDLVLTKWIALKGTSALASCRAEELSSRFPSVMIRDAAGFTRYLSTEREYQISGGYGAAAIYPLGKGGVLGGLWNMQVWKLIFGKYRSARRLWRFASFLT